MIHPSLAFKIESIIFGIVSGQREEDLNKRGALGEARLDSHSLLCRARSFCLCVVQRCIVPPDAVVECSVDIRRSHAPKRGTVRLEFDDGTRRNARAPRIHLLHGVGDCHAGHNTRGGQESNARCEMQFGLLESHALCSCWCSDPLFGSPPLSPPRIFSLFFVFRTCACLSRWAICSTSASRLSA